MLYAHPYRLKMKRRREIAEMALATVAVIVCMAVIGFAFVVDERDAAALAKAKIVGKR